MKDRRCIDYRKAIRESALHLFLLERQQNKALLRDRMRFLRFLKSGACTSQAQAGRGIGLGLRGAEKLWKKYRLEGLPGLLTYPYRGRKEKLSEAQKQALEEELAKDQYQSLQQVCHYIEQQSGVDYTVPGMYYVLKRLKVKNKTGRPIYHDKDHKGEKRFKKTFPALKQRYGKRCYFEDELRGGTRSQRKRRWTPKGHRPLCKVKLGYEFTYLYCAIAPATGNLIALLLPDMSKGCFEIFLDHFKRQTKAFHRNHPVVIIADKAGAHQKQVGESRGIAMEHLPRGCPELNPVERFFEELRKELANHIFSTLKQVEAFLSKVLKKYWRNPKQIIQLCHYPYMRTP